MSSNSVLETQPSPEQLAGRGKAAVEVLTLRTLYRHITSFMSDGLRQRIPCSRRGCGKERARGQGDWQAPPDSAVSQSPEAANIGRLELLLLQTQTGIAGAVGGQIVAQWSKPSLKHAARTFTWLIRFSVPVPTHYSVRNGHHATASRQHGEQAAAAAAGLCQEQQWRHPWPHGPVEAPDARITSSLASPLERRSGAADSQPQQQQRAAALLPRVRFVVSVVVARHGGGRERRGGDDGGAAAPGAARALAWGGSGERSGGWCEEYCCIDERTRTRRERCEDTAATAAASIGDSVGWSEKCALSSPHNAWYDALAEHQYHGEPFGQASAVADRTLREGLSLSGKRPKKKPPPPMIDMHWSAEAGTESDTNGVDPSDVILPPAAGAPVSPRRVSPTPELCAPRTSEKALVPPPMTPPAVRVPHVHVNGIAHGAPVHAEVGAHAKSITEPEKVPVSPLMVQRLKTSVEPPKTPSGNPAFESFNDDDESKLSASQRVRMGLSALMTQGNGVGSGASETMRRKSHEEGAERNQDEGVAAPMSCPRLSQTSGKQQFSALRETRHLPQQQQRRGSNSIASKLLPSRMCLNNLIEYVRELHQSAASLRLQLEQTKQNAERELVASQLEARMLQESMQRVEVEREQTRTRIQEQEQLIHDLHAQVSNLQQQIQVMRTSQSAFSFREGEVLMSNSSTSWVEQQSERSAVAAGGEVLGHLVISENADLDSLQAKEQPQPVASNQECVVSPRLARPLWEPWSSGSNSPLATATPPMFTIAPSSLDLLPSSPQLTSETASSSSSVNQAHVLKSIVSPAKVIRDQASEESVSTVPLPPQGSATTENQEDATFSLMAPPVFTLGAVSAPDLALTNQPQMNDAIVDFGENATLIARAEMEDQLHHMSPEASSPRKMVTSAEVMPPAQPPQIRDDVSNDESSGTVDQPTATPPKLFYPQAHSSGKPPLPKAAAESTAVSLEKLLTDFFLEFDKGKMRMAEVYGKRYVGHEDRLFAELTRRYGKEKVSTLQRRYEESLIARDDDQSQHPDELLEAEAVQSQGTPTAQSSVADEDMTPAQQDQTMQWKHINSSPAKSEEVPTQKVSPKGQSPPIAGFYDTGFPPVLSCIEEDSEIETDVSSSTSNSAAPSLPVVTDIHGPESSRVESRYAPASQCSEQSPPVSPQRVLPQRRQTPYFPVNGVVTLKTDAPPPLSMRDSSQAYSAGTKSSPIRRQGEPSTGHPPMFANFSGENDGKKPVAAFSSPASSGSVEIEKTTVVSKPRAVEPQITLESLLRELYKKHQPDKLRNVVQVAKEYAGRERELVRLLKAKYGALSVKRLEENLSALEKANSQPATTTTKAQLNSKKRGFISALLIRGVLVSFTALTLGSAGLMLLDSRECHSPQYAIRPDADGNAAACFKLTLDLEEFAFGKIQDYAAQSYPVECFCSEWAEREDAMLSRYSGTNVVDLAKMLPFSRAAVDAYLVDTPVRGYYTQFAKPLVEISRDYGAIVRSAIEEVGGEISSQFTKLRDRILPSITGVDELLASETDSTKDKESAASALTKIAQASKSLLSNVQEETADGAGFESETEINERSDAVADADHVSGSDLEISSGGDEQAAVVDSAIVEVEVRQEGNDISYPETKESTGSAVEVRYSDEEPPAMEGDLLDAVAHVIRIRGGDETTHESDVSASTEVSEPRNDESAAQVTAAQVVEEESSVMGEADQTEHRIPELMQEAEQDPSTTKVEDVVAVDASEESVNAGSIGGDWVAEVEPLETNTSEDIVPVVDAEESQSVDESEDNKPYVADVADESSSLPTVSESGELELDSNPSDNASDASNGDINKKTPVQFDGQEDEAAATARSDEAPEAAEVSDLTAVVQSDSEDVKATSEDRDDARDSEVAAFVESQLPAESEPPPPKEESSSTDLGSQAANNDGDYALTDDQEDDDDGEDFDFDVDPWELLEMAERAAAAQLHTLEK